MPYDVTHLSLRAAAVFCPCTVWLLLAVLEPVQESDVSNWESATDSAERSNASMVTHIHDALIARSSQTSMERANASDASLDTVANGKAAAAIAGTFSDLAQAVSDAGSMAARG